MEIIRHCINMNKRVFLSLSQKHNLSHNSKGQEHFWRNCSFQEVPNQVEKLWKIQGVGFLTSSRGVGGLQEKCPTWRGYGYFLELHDIDHGFMKCNFF